MTDAIERMVDGVTIRKSFETDEFPVPAVTFEIESERGDPVTVTLTDEIPEEVAMEQIGFHPDYHNDQWTAYPEGRVEFTHDLDARESVTTIYGVRLDDSDSQESFLHDPDITVERMDADTDPEGVIETGDAEADTEETDDVDVADPDRTNVVREVIEGERDTIPGLGDDEAETAEVNGGETSTDDITVDEDTEPVIADDGDTSREDGTEEDEITRGAQEDSESVPSVNQDETERPTQDRSGPTATPGSIVSALAEELREDHADDEDLKTIRETVGADQSTETRIGHLQSRVSDLEAYSNAIEEFIDEHGSAQQLLQSVDNDLDELSTQVAELQTTTEKAASERHELQNDLAAATDRIDRLASNLDALDENVQSLDDDIDDLDEDIEDVEGDVESVRSDVHDRLDDTVQDIEDELQTVREDVEELREWRNQLTDVFGTGTSEE